MKEDAARFVSYSANREDVYLNRLFATQAKGFYVDVGAAHPMFENDTKALYDRGWSGINIEPSTEFFDVLASERPRDRNLHMAVSDQPGLVTFYQVSGTGLSTLDAAEAERARGLDRTVVERSVPADTLGHILAQADPGPIDMLKVDVEGAELAVLRSNDWVRFRPRLIMVEATFPETPVRRPDKVTPFLAMQGYHRVFFDGLNDYYVEQGSALPAEVFDRPANIFDDYVVFEVDSLKQERRNAQAYIASLEQALTIERNAVADGNRQLRGLHHAADALAVDLARARAEMVTMLGRAAEQAVRWDQQAQRMDQMVAAHSTAQRGWEADADGFRRELHRLHLEVDGLVRSTSWRVTRPLRALRRPGRTLRLLLRGPKT